MRTLAVGLTTLAGLMSDTRWPNSRADEEELAYRESVDVCDRIATDASSRPPSGHLATAADVRNNLGCFLMRIGRPADAEVVLRAAVAQREQVLAQDPDVPENRARLGGIVISLGEALRDQGRYREARDVARRAIAIERDALGSSLNNPLFLSWLSAAHLLLAETQLSEADLKSGFESVDASVLVRPEKRETYYEAAAALARCVRRLERAPNMNGLDRRELMRTVADRAVNLLRDAIAKGYGATAKSLENDVNFRSLRSFPTYQRLIKELPEK
jgi:tetratricopeptide (TPR) repeat protein